MKKVTYLKKNKHQKIKRSVHQKVSSLLASAGIASALVSCWTTASGLNQYVFHHFWQASVISIAIQSALYVCNIKGPEILHSLGFFGKAVFILFNFVVLLSSSVFSFVYMEGYAYPDDVFLDDADRILSTSCLEINYELIDNINMETERSQQSIENYINNLLVNDSFESDISSNLNILIESLDIEEFASVRSLLYRVAGNDYTEDDIVILNEYLGNLKARFQSEIISNETRLQENRESLSEDSERLATFNNTADPVYSQLNERVSSLHEENNDLQDNIERLNSDIGTVDSILLEISSVDSSMNNNLRRLTDDLRGLMVDDQADASDFQDTANDIYNLLLDNQVSKSDIRITEFDNFQIEANNFGKLQESRLKIYYEIDLLNARYQEVDTNRFNATPADSNQSVDLDVDSVINVEFLSAWREYWHERINSIRTNISDLSFYTDDNQTANPMTSNENHQDEKYDSQNTYNINSKSDILKELSEKERIYVSDLNGFERAWTVLFTDHPYKLMCIFSLFFALFLDLFSLIMGILIYLYNNNGFDKESGL